VSASCLIIIDSEADHQVSSTSLYFPQYIIIDSEADHQSVYYLTWHLTLIGYEPCAVIAQNRPPLLLITPGNSWTSPTTFLIIYCTTLNSLIQYLVKNFVVLAPQLPHHHPTQIGVTRRDLLALSNHSTHHCNSFTFFNKYSYTIPLYCPLWSSIVFPLPRTC
jgi:hypothetical protein